MNQRFTLKNFGIVHYFLGIQVKRTAEGIHQSQTKYIKNVCYGAKIQCQSNNTPMM